MSTPIRATTSLRTLLLYAHDTYGLGHLRRNLAIAGHLLERRPGLRVVLMSGSSVADRFDLPAGLSLVRLPPVHKVGAERYEPRDSHWDLATVRRARTAVMADVARRFRPDVFLVDHAPQGMGGELLPVYDALAAGSPETRIILGLRDVLDDPSVVRRTWEAAGVHRTLEDIFDEILVYGSRELLDIGDAYALSGTIRSRLTYTGYVCRPCPGEGAAAVGDAAGKALGKAPFVLGTAGGGGDGAEVLTATLDACRSLGVASLVVTGPLMDRHDRAAVEARAAADPLATVVELLTDLGAKMSSASAVVTMGGYNTLCELVARGTPTIVVPRVQPRREQAIRAELFARRGVVAVVAPGDDLGARLAPSIAEAVAAGRRPPGDRLDLAGLERIDAHLEHAARSVRDRAERSRPRSDRTDRIPA